MLSATLLFGPLPMLTVVPNPLDEIHLVLAMGGRFVLTIAATLFLAYAVFMTSLVVTSAVRGGVRMLQAGQGWADNQHRVINRDQMSLVGGAGRS